MSKIKTMTVPNKTRINPSIGKLNENDTIRFSFESFETNEYFDIDAGCAYWSKELFSKLKEISKLTLKDIMGKKMHTLRIHNHSNATNCPTNLPKGVELKDFYQIRLGAANGGIHGIFVDNVFYVIWLDPLHNMYPDDKFGGAKKVKIPKNCCDIKDERIEELQSKVNELSKNLEDEKCLNQLILEEMNKVSS